MMQSGLGSMDPAVLALKLGKVSDEERIYELLENKALMEILRKREREKAKDYHEGGSIPYHDQKHALENQGKLTPGSWTEEDLRAHAPVPGILDALSGRAFLGTGPQGQRIGPVDRVGPGTAINMQINKLADLSQRPYGEPEIYNWKGANEGTDSPLEEASTQEQMDMLAALGMGTPTENYDLVAPVGKKPTGTSGASDYFRDKTRELLARPDPEEETDYIDRLLSSKIFQLGALMAAGDSPNALTNIGGAANELSQRVQAQKVQERELGIQEQAARNLRPQVSLKDFLFSKGWNNDRISALTMMETDSEEYVLAMEQLKALEEEWRQNYGIGMRNQYAFREPLEEIIDLSGGASNASPAGATVIGQGVRGA